MVCAACLAMATEIMGAASSLGNVEIRIVDTRTVGRGENGYQGWPTLALLPGGELILNYTGGKVAHNCPFGRVEILRSSDEGTTWSWPQVVYDGVLDDRGVGILHTQRGTLLSAVYTTEPPVGFAPENADRLTKDLADGWSSVLFPVAEAWGDAVSRLNAQQRAKESGGWILRSVDGGLNWSSRIRVPVRSWHGPIETRDGRLLYAGVNPAESASKRLEVIESIDDGVSWQTLSHLPTPEGAAPDQFDGPHVVQCADGTLVCQLRRSVPGDAAGQVYQSVSTDGGRTWSVARSIGVRGAPTHLIRLADGCLLMSYGLRIPPFGARARVSRDRGATWSESLILSQDADNADLGFTTSVELGDGSILSVWYERPALRSHARLRQVRWHLAGKG